ncbi:MAG: N(4)-(beta-N-acetylglucosaminyl)-L-asparaginase [Chitinophagales bacterium]|nr:N(4)-(beta-N-acetylglucosaminyl)-L-asparaginase [Chitinophagales bacterium]
MTSRRKFLQNVSWSAIAGLLIPTLSKGNTFTFSSPYSKKGHLILSTWQHGLAANIKGMEILQAGGRPIDAVQQGVMVVESDPDNLSVGLGGLPDRDGHVTLDACLMDELGNAGSVSFLEGIDHPVAVARLIMDHTPHVMLSGSGALQFALQNGFTQKIGLSAETEKEWKQWVKTSDYDPVINIENHDTIGMICRNAEGNFGGACTTSGLAYKLHGRVGDSPIPGAGLFVDNEIGAATSTGLGEAVIKICGSHAVVEMMRHGKSPQKACEEAVSRIASKQKNYRDFQVGFLAINKAGEIGAYSIQPGFNYAFAHDTQNELLNADSLIKKSNRN